MIKFIPGTEAWKARRARKRAWAEFAAEMSTKGLSPADIIPANQSGKPVPRKISTQLVQRNIELSGWVYACVSLRSKSIGSVGWNVERDIGDTWAPVEQDHPIKALLGARANRHWSAGELLERVQICLDMTGEGYIIKLRVNDTIAELWTLPPGSLSPIANSQEFVTEYEFTNGGRKVRIPADDVIVVMYPHPSELFRGLSPLQAAQAAINADINAVTWNESLTVNRAGLETAVLFKEAMTKEQWDVAVERITSQYSGIHNAGRPWVFDSDAQVQSFGTTPKDMDWLEGRKYNRQEILSAFGVPPPMLQVYDDATLANIETARKIFWEDTMLPIINKYAQAFTRALCPEFSCGLRVVPNTIGIGPLQQSSIDRIDAATKLWNMGVPLVHINKTLALGLPDFPGIDMGYVPSSAMPADIDFEDSFIGNIANEPDPEEQQAIEDFDLETQLLEHSDKVTEAFDGALAALARKITV